MSEHMTIWEALKPTPKEMTKPFKRQGGFGGTDIKPAFRIQRLTEVLGPCGKGWGCEVVNRWREDFGSVTVVFVTARLWWMDAEGSYKTNEHTGGTVVDRTPDEAYKMAETDAYGKCALDIGVAADVYLGEFDGSKYHQSASDRSSQSSTPASNRRDSTPAWDGKDWRTCPMHLPFSNLDKVRGKALGEISQSDKKTLAWLANEWSLKEGSSAQDKQLRKALDMALEQKRKAEEKKAAQQAPPEPASDDPPFE